MKMDLYLLKLPYRKILTPLAKKLHWLNPDIVSYSAVIVAAGTGFCFYKAADSRFLLLVAIGLTLVRMTFNTIDGVMAIQRGKHSLEGEIVNALPDRYSDILVVGGIVLSPLCQDWLGLTALATMLLVSYTGMLGKATGVSWQHHGPMGKVERMITMMVFALFQFFLLPDRQAVNLGNVAITPMEMAMGLFVILGQFTILRRLTGQLKEIHEKEAAEPQSSNEAKAIVVYDSMTGNTRKIADEIARALRCNALKVSDAIDITPFTLVVLGSPNIRKHPTMAMQKFQDRIGAHPPMLAVFNTFGLPIWGHITAPMCLNCMAENWDIKPIAKFSCPGYHRKYKTYKGHPNPKDIEKAYRFGLKLANKLSRYPTKGSG
jgi:phosphatidylglycerophosphate synthase/flavodoxin